MEQEETEIVNVLYGRSTIIYCPCCGTRNKKDVPSVSKCDHPSCDHRFDVRKVGH